MRSVSFNIDKVAVAGVFTTAMLSPCCFPLFGMLLSTLGFGSFELFGDLTMKIFQFFTIISVVGIWMSFRKIKKPAPLIISVLSALLIFISYYIIDADYWIFLTYGGMAGMLVASLLNYKLSRSYKMQSIQLYSKITCPHCGHSATEEMPTNACTYFYECRNCKKRLQPKNGDCCVYCSYGTVKCPPMQTGNGCC